MTERTVNDDALSADVSHAATARAAFDWVMLARVLLALGGSYVMAAVVSMAIARGAPALGLMVRSEGAAAGTLIGLLIWPCAIVWTFAAHRVARIAFIMGSVTAAGAVTAWMAGQPT